MCLRAVPKRSQDDLGREFVPKNFNLRTIGERLNPEKPKKIRKGCSNDRVSLFSAINLRFSALKRLRFLVRPRSGIL